MMKQKTTQKQEITATTTKNPKIVNVNMEIEIL